MLVTCFLSLPPPLFFFKKAFDVPMSWTWFRVLLLADSNGLGCSLLRGMAALKVSFYFDLPRDILHWDSDHLVRLVVRLRDVARNIRGWWSLCTVACFANRNGWNFCIAQTKERPFFNCKIALLSLVQIAARKCKGNIIFGTFHPFFFFFCS